MADLKHSRTVEEYLYMLDPIVIADNGPHTIRTEDGATIVGYHRDPYGVFFRRDVRLTFVVDQLGWDRAVAIPEIGDLVQKTWKMLEAYDKDVAETREKK